MRIKCEYGKTSDNIVRGLFFKATDKVGGRLLITLNNPAGFIPRSKLRGAPAGRVLPGLSGIA